MERYNETVVMSIHLLRHTSTQQENTAGKHRDEIFEHVIFVFRTLVPSAWALLYVQLSCSVDNPFITTAYPISPFSVCKNANGYKRSFDANAANISSLSLSFRLEACRRLSIHSPNVCLCRMYAPGCVCGGRKMYDGVEIRGLG